MKRKTRVLVHVSDNMFPFSSKAEPSGLAGRLAEFVTNNSLDGVCIELV